MSRPQFGKSDRGRVAMGIMAYQVSGGRHVQFEKRKAMRRIRETHGVEVSADVGIRVVLEVALRELHRRPERFTPFAEVVTRVADGLGTSPPNWPSQLEMRRRTVPRDR